MKNNAAPDQTNQLTGKASGLVLGVALTCVLVLAVASRFWMAEWPNFKPVAAVAIFIGYFCHRKALAVGAVVLMMLVSDAVLGFYEPMVMASVYASLLLACGLGMLLQKRIGSDSKVAFRIGSVSAAALAASVLFYLLTNSAVWAAGWYPGDLQGLIAALVAGLPFFKFTVAGNLLFTGLIFSLYFALVGMSQNAVQPRALAAAQARRT